MIWKKRKIFLIVSFLILVFLGGNFVRAQTAPADDDLQAKIDQRNAQIKQLEDEINQYNVEVANTESQAQTLQSTLKNLDLTKKKITTDLSLTQNKITKANLTIDQLGNQITDTQKQIETNRQAIISAFKNTQSMEDIGIFEIILSSSNIGDIWNDIDNTKQVQDTIREKSNELLGLQKDAEVKQQTLQGQKVDLSNLKQDLNSKQQAVTQTAQEKANLLTETKNKEQAFQALLATKEEQRAEFEKEVTDFEAQLHLTIDKSSYPSAKHGILSWPLDNPPTQACDTLHKLLSCIVRGFSHPVVKNGVTTDPGHNGVDFRASTGTKVKNVLDGTVAGTGNTDIYKGCYGLGKWVMVNHPNGLSSIYMHLSVISVSPGQDLKTGDLIGLSGNTGNSEAPHLHVTVYATEGVRIEQFVNSIGCKQAVVPLADPKAYLDPLTYFPAI